MTVMACPICECALQQFKEGEYRSDEAHYKCSNCGYDNVMAKVFGSKKEPIKKLCDYCKSENMIQLQTELFQCEGCGFGWNGKPKDMHEHLNDLMDLAQALAKKHPKATKKELCDIMQKELHIKEKHPIDSRGWCEICQKKTD